MPTTKRNYEYEQARKPAVARLSFSEKGKTQPQGVKDMAPEKDVIIVLKGKMKSISTGNEWDKGKTVEVELASCEMTLDRTEREIKKEIVSLNDALEEAQGSRKKVK